MAGKYYFAAYAQKIVASGSTFFDDAVSGLFSPHAADKSDYACSWCSWLQIPSKENSGWLPN